MPKKHDYSLGQRFATIVRTTVSVCVFRGRCLLHSVVVTGDGADAEVEVYDDPGGNSNQKLDIYSPTKYTTPVIFPHPVVFENGIYLKLNAATALTTVTFTPAERGTLRD